MASGHIRLGRTVMLAVIVTMLGILCPLDFVSSRHGALQGQDRQRHQSVEHIVSSGKSGRPANTGDGVVVSGAPSGIAARTSGIAGALVLAMHAETALAGDPDLAGRPGSVGELNLPGLAAGIALPLVYQFTLQAQETKVAELGADYQRVKAGETVFRNLLPVAVVVGIAVALFTNIGIIIGSVFGFNPVGLLAGVFVPIFYFFFLQLQLAEVVERETVYQEAQGEQAASSSRLPLVVVAGGLLALFTNAGMFLRP